MKKNKIRVKDIYSSLVFNTMISGFLMNENEFTASIRVENTSARRESFTFKIDYNLNGSVSIDILEKNGVGLANDILNQGMYSFYEDFKEEIDQSVIDSFVKNKVPAAALKDSFKTEITFKEVIENDIEIKTVREFEESIRLKALLENENIETELYIYENNYKNVKLIKKIWGEK